VDWLPPLEYVLIPQGKQKAPVTLSSCTVPAGQLTGTQGDPLEIVK
jgi:hypothetical protein